MQNSTTILSNENPQITNDTQTIVSQVGSATGNMASFLDHYLQPIVQTLLAYLKDSTQFIREITAFPIEPNELLVTVDVKSLYMCILTPEGLEACYRVWLKTEMTERNMAWFGLLLFENEVNNNSQT